MFLPLAPMALSTFDDGSDGSDTSDEWMMVESSDSDEDEDEATLFHNQFHQLAAARQRLLLTW